MSPPRRRSARLASASKPPANTNKPLPSLSSLVERDESQRDRVPHNMDAIVSSPMSVPKTPAASSPIKPPLSEMHPSKVHPTMASVPSSGLRFGFTDINPAKAASAREQPSGITQATPSKTAPPPSSPFTFRLVQEPSDLNLGPEAQRMMDELREEALRIKADLVAKRELEKAEEAKANVTNRKIAALPKGKAGRYSAAHMSQFKKMDSIENHPSAFRAQSGRSTPLVAGVKRSPSKANLDDLDSSRSKYLTSLSSSKTSHASSRNEVEPVSPAKKAKKRIAEEDEFSSRPISRDGTAIPRPKSAGKGAIGIPRSHTTLAALMTPTQASLARAAAAKDNSTLLPKSPSIPSFHSIKRSTTTADLTVKIVGTGESQPLVRSPTSRFDKVKSLLRGQRAGPAKAPSAIPQISGQMSKTPLPSSVTMRNVAPRGLATTPGKRFMKAAMLTPEARRTAAAQQSPSPVKSGIPKSKTRRILGEVSYPILDSVMTEDPMEDDVHYPDLFGDRALPGLPTGPTVTAVPPTVPGTFTFRSDHTIRFGSASPTGFGTSPGQASLRHVRQSILPTANMPGSFPTSIFGPAVAAAAADNNKENKAPQPPAEKKPLPAFPHGLNSKKRHRVSSDEEEEAEKEAEERAAKKQKFDAAVPDGVGHGMLLAASSRPLDATIGKTPDVSPSKMRAVGGGMTPSPVKRKAVLSLSRLNMLARPKMRK